MKIEVYQIPCDRDVRGLKFFNYEKTIKYGRVIDPTEYRKVFDGDIEAKSLEDVYARLNQSPKPPSYNGHNLSVSDVVVNEDGAFFCDSVGFVKLDNQLFQETKGE